MATIVLSPTTATIPTQTAVRPRCPACRANGSFEPIIPNDVRAVSGETLGVRKCPHPKCGALVFFILQKDSTFVSYPAERIDFDTSGIPTSVHDAFEEAITCHSDECYVASAIMVRKTLELICHDRGATGANLKERLAALKGEVILPQELFDGLDDLRLLGNDAAHVESQIFDQVGKQEAEVGIELTKEILKAAYQYSSLLSKLRALKKVP